MTYRELQRMFDRGATLERTELTERFTMQEYLERYGDSHLPMFSVVQGAVRVLTEEGSVPEPGTEVVSLVLPTGSGSPKG